MRNIKLDRKLDASRSAVWAVLADYPNIASWNSGVNKSFSTGAATEGVGATRHCDLAPMGGLEETIREWEPESKLAISIDKASKLPIKSGLATFTMAESGEATDFTLSYDYEPKFAPLVFIMGPMLDKQFKKGFSGFIDDLEKAARAPATT
jgi:uncharacterized protein YndB with AHSA1/START domain